MSGLVGAVVVAAVLAIAAGLAKLASPASAARALGAVGWPSAPSLVRLGCIVEVALGALVLATRSWVPLVLLAASYAGFTCFNVVALRADSVAPCGCFGDGTARSGARHVWIDAALAAALLAAAASGTPAALDVVRASVPTGVATVLTALAAAWLAALFLSGSLTEWAGALADG